MRRNCLNEVLNEPRSLTIWTTQNELKLSKNVLVLSFFFLKMRIKKLSYVILKFSKRKDTVGVMNKKSP